VADEFRKVYQKAIFLFLGSSVAYGQRAVIFFYIWEGRKVNERAMGEEVEWDRSHATAICLGRTTCSSTAKVIWSPFAKASRVKKRVRHDAVKKKIIPKVLIDFWCLSRT